MVAVGRRPKQFKIENKVLCDVGAFHTAAGRFKTEDFRGHPRSGRSARGFVGFGEEGGRDDRVVSKGLQKISRADLASSREGL